MSNPPSAAPSRRSQRQAEQPRRGDDRERALLDAAAAAVHDGTFETMSIAELAAIARVSRPTFYFYFASKGALLATLVEQVLAEIFSNLESTASRVDVDLRSRVREGVDHIVVAWLSHREILCAAVELSSQVPAIAGLWSRAVVGSIEIFLEGIDTSPAIGDGSTLRRQAHLLAWAQERNLYNLAKSGGDADAFAVLTADLTEMWISALHGAAGPHDRTEGQQP